MARRIESIWRDISRQVSGRSEQGPCGLTLLVDDDHYACVTTARDESRHVIDIGCDFFGVAAETSVLVPLARSAELGVKVNIAYCRPTERLEADGRLPDTHALQLRGLDLRRISELHAKYLLWDNDAAAITSFNWLSGVVDGARLRGSELGVLIRGSEVRSMVTSKTRMREIGLQDYSAVPRNNASA